MNKYLRDMLVDLEVYELEVIKIVEVEEHAPEDVIKKDGYNYILNDKGLTPEEVNTALLAKQTKFIRTIKNIALFYFWGSIAAAVIYLIYFFATFEQSGLY